MNLFQQHGVRDLAAAAAQIPVIDFGLVFAGAAGALERTAAENLSADGRVNILATTLNALKQSPQVILREACRQVRDAVVIAITRAV